LAASDANFYNGDTTTNACGNFFQPTVIATFGSGYDKLDVRGNSNDSDDGAGVIAGKNWDITDATLSLVALVIPTAMY